MPEFLKHCLTGRDNESYDIARVLLCAGAMTYIAISIYVAIRSGQFEPDKYGSGLGWILGGGGIGIGAKAHTEPSASGAAA